MVAAAVLHVAPIDGQGKDIHLPPGIVDVVFVVHLMPVGAQDVGQRRAIGRTASVANVQRSGRVGRDKFKQDFLRVHRLMTAKVSTFFDDAGQHGAVMPTAETYVNESWSCDFQRSDTRVLWHGGNNGVCELTRVALENFGVLQGNVAGEIPMFRIFAAFQFLW
ncbi:hypothetical protein HMPREF9080_02031 [Cardiobacterium valvarum F0432]|uniref:Uncharacterized protein n=1 Tax=Cardiobacterium valvarum F0432 TaxID=797473 RepID=G9ZGX3_9GAMM|nr:hypothetical protein HMPREF9080_02031 [Cardiobacterium valvarum F0432]